MNDGQFSGEHVDAVKEEGRLRLNDLPDELLIEIFNRLLDLKCLCLCSLVSPRFSSLILLHVHSVYFSFLRRTTVDDIPTPATGTDSLVMKTLRFFVNGIVSAIPLQYFRQFLAPKPLPPLIFAASFLGKFNSIRSLQCVFPSSPNKRNPNPNDDSIYKWAAKFGPTIDTLVFLSTSSIRVGTEFDFDEQEQVDPVWLGKLIKSRAHLALGCLNDAIIWLLIVLGGLIRDHPLLENITITDSNNHGSLSLRDSKVAEMRNSVNSLSHVELIQLNTIEVPANVRLLHVPVLKLPVSGKVMVNATLVLMEMVDRRHEHRDWGVEAESIAPLFAEQGEEEFAEGIVEMLVNHNSMMFLL